MDDRKRFTGRHVLITGAARGIGLEIAMQFAKEGAVLSLLDYHHENLQAALQQLKADGREVYGYAIDVSIQSDVVETIKAADSIRPIDILINNAGITMDNLLLRMTEEAWDRVISVNLKSCFNTVKAVTKPMMK